MAFYIVAAEEQGVSMEQLTEQFKMTYLKSSWFETHIYPPEPSMRIIAKY